LYECFFTRDEKTYAGRNGKAGGKSKKGESKEKDME
jgi:hypothetical protein